ncbi:MAG: response regulator, partial [Acidobacteriota bacterium]
MSGESRGVGGSARVLVVDDDHRNVRLMESILKTEGYGILRAYDGQEALDVIEHQIPDLVLLDVMMPRMNGIELCRRLRARHSTRLLPIIMVTALNAQEDKVHALETGADDFLSKPINRKVLLAKVRSILRVKSLQDEVERQKEQLERTNDELLRMQRFKESMTQMVVHDMKNSLTGIMGNVQLIQMQTDPPVSDRLSELVQRSQESCAQLMRMVLNILHIGRLEENKMPLRPAPLALDQIARDNMNELMSLSTREGISLESRIPIDLPQPKADPELVGRVIGNLLSNALKHTP